MAAVVAAVEAAVVAAAAAAAVPTPQTVAVAVAAVVVVAVPTPQTVVSHATVAALLGSSRAAFVPRLLPARDPRDGRRRDRRLQRQGRCRIQS